jgi:hypothetical protein
MIFPKIFFPNPSLESYKHFGPLQAIFPQFFLPPYYLKEVNEDIQRHISNPLFIIFNIYTLKVAQMVFLKPF